MKKLSICGTDIAAFTIVLPTVPHPAEKNAAEFLQMVIEASCGVKLPISDAKADHGIIIGSRDTNPRIKWDGFRITMDNNSLYLAGTIARGTLYAAYDFAEKHLGYRTFADDCIVIHTEGKAVEKESPHVLIRIFADWYTRIPPKYTRARDNVLIRYCTMHACCRHAIDDPTCERNYARFYREMHE